MIPARQLKLLNTEPVPALDRGLSILGLLAQSRNGLTMADVARKLEAPGSTVHGLMNTLERRGYIVRAPGAHRYTLGAAPIGLGREAARQSSALAGAIPILYDLIRDTGLTAHLARLEAGQAVILQKVSPLGAPPVATWCGKALGLHCSAVGKALLASLPEAAFHSVLDHFEFTRHNQNTITSATQLKQEIVSTRAAGYALESEEEELGFRCIGAPIPNKSNTAFLALSVAGSTKVLSQNSVAELSRLIMRAAERISEKALVCTS